MTYLELQTALKEYRNQGHELQCKLNAKKDVLQAEFDRISAIQPEVDTVNHTADETDTVDNHINHVYTVDENTEQLTGQYTELTCAVRLPLVLEPPTCEVREKSKVALPVTHTPPTDSPLDFEHSQTVEDNCLSPSVILCTIIVAMSVLLDYSKLIWRYLSPYIFRGIDKLMKSEGIKFNLTIPTSTKRIFTGA